MTVNLAALSLDPLLAFFGGGLGETEASISSAVSTCIDRTDCPADGIAPDGQSTARYGNPTHLIYDNLLMRVGPPDNDANDTASNDADGDGPVAATMRTA